MPNIAVFCSLAGTYLLVALRSVIQKLQMLERYGLRNFWSPT